MFYLLFWKNFKFSKMATFISIVGTLTRYAGVACFANGVIGAGLICIAIGIGIYFLAESVGFNGWKKEMKKNGVEQKIREGNLQLAIQLYNSEPQERILKYFESLNTQVASQLRTMIANNAN